MADNNTFLNGSICLSDIPRELIKKVVCRDGVTRLYLNIGIHRRKTPQTYPDGRTITHYISCAPRKEERVDGVNYFIGDLEERSYTPASATPSADAISAAPAVSADEYPF